MAHSQGEDLTRYLNPDNTARPTFTEMVASSRVRLWSVVHNFGRNPAAGTTQEDLWEVGGVMVWPAAAATISVVSDSAQDAVGGTGASTLEIQGLDSEWNMIEEEITLTGLTPAVTTKLFMRVNSVECHEVGSGGVNAGTISATLSGNDIFQVSVGDGVDHSSHYSVPAGHRAFLTQISTWQGLDGAASSGFMHRDFGKSWHKLLEMATYRNQTDAHVCWAEVMDEKADVRLVTTAKAGSVDQGGYYIMILEKYK